MEIAIANHRHLPNELLELIAEQAAPETIINLRLASKGFKLVTEDVFFRRFFLKRRVMLSDQKSMGRLRKLTAQSPIARAIEELRFSTARIRNPDDKATMDTVAAAGSWTPDIERKEKRRDHISLWQAQVDYLEVDVRADLLRIFDNFARNKHCPVIVATGPEDDDTELMPLKPLGRLRDQLDYDGQQWIDNFIGDRAFEVILWGLQSCGQGNGGETIGLSPSRLQLGNLHSGCRLKHSNTGSLDDIWFCPTFNLKTLDLTISSELPGSLHSDPVFDGLSPFLAVLAKADHLEELYLTMTDASSSFAWHADLPGIFGLIANESWTLSKLRVFQFDGLYISPQAFDAILGFVLTRQSTLREVIIKNIPEWNADFWEACEHRLRSCLDSENREGLKFEARSDWTRDTVREDYMQNWVVS